jgi:hypothetical protein
MSEPSKTASPMFCAGLGGFYFEGLHLGGIGSHDGTPFFSEQGVKWVQARAGSAPTIQNTDLAAQTWQQEKQIRQVMNLTKDTSQLPQKSVVEAYFSLFCSSTMSCMFPLVDDASFLQVIAKAYNQQGSQNLESIRAKACVLAFTAFQSHMAGKLDCYEGLDGDQCATQAELLMPYLLADASCESIQVCATLVSKPPPPMHMNGMRLIAQYCYLVHV